MCDWYQFEISCQILLINLVLIILGINHVIVGVKYSFRDSHW